MSSLRVILLTVLADSIYNILIFFAEKMWKATKKFQHICVSLDVNFNESLTNDVVSFEQLCPGDYLGHVLLYLQLCGNSNENSQDIFLVWVLDYC